MSKGSKQRKAQVSNDQVEHNWKKIFTNGLKIDQETADKAVIGKLSTRHNHGKPTPKSVQIYEDSYLHDLDQRLDEQSERINRDKK